MGLSDEGASRVTLGEVSPPSRNIRHTLKIRKHRDRQLIISDTGLQLREQADEYANRALALEDYNYLDFFLDTYEHYDKPSRVHREGTVFPPLEGARKRKSRRVRQAGHETLPQFIGRWFPKRSRGEGSELYFASMLALFKPWRRLDDLKLPTDSFQQSFDTFYSSMSPQHIRMMDNIDYYYLSAEAANIPEAKAGEGPVHKLAALTAASLEVDCDAEETAGTGDAAEEVTQELLEQAFRSVYTPRDQIFASQAMAVAEASGIFSNTPARRDVWSAVASVATHEQLQRYSEWEDYIKNYIRGREDSTCQESRAYSTSGADCEYITDCADVLLTPPTSNSRTTVCPVASPGVRLNPEQSRAHQIIYRHMKSSGRGQSPPQLLMVVNGAGGTGKSALIDAVTSSAASLGMQKALAKTATSGVAATRIGGTTIHSWAGLGITNKVDTSNAKTLEKRAKNIGTTRYLIVDEFSMMTKGLMESLSEVCCQTLCKLATCNKGPFGGINVILLGDLHQFPPVAKNGALYRLGSPHEKGSLGRHLFERFTTVVTLKQQMRVQDQVWIDMLDRLRTGGCTDQDVRMLDSMVLAHPACDRPDFNASPWKDAVLITSRNSVRDSWNDAAVKRHSFASGQQHYICPAEDSTGSTANALSPKQRLAAMSMGVKHTGRLPARTWLSVGMKAMVLLNIATEADLANGTRGEIRDIILDPREPAHESLSDGQIHLSYPPACVIIKLESSGLPQLDGLGRNEIPISPSQSTFTIKNADGSKATVRRRQYAITPAYAFTDYKAQGQTIEYVLVDLAEPTKNALDPFHAYVALSRSRGRSTIRLFRPCPQRLLTEHPSRDLLPEDARLGSLDNLTRLAYDRDLLGW